MTDVASIAEDVLRGHVLRERELVLQFGAFQLKVRSNSGELLQQLEQYLASFRFPAACDVETVVAVTVLETETACFEGPFRDWVREPGKRGRKDEYRDLSEARVVHKVRTGMHFLQSQTERIAWGPCLENDNQVINFLCTQYTTWLQQRGAIMCHAAACSFGDGCLGIAGLSGGGKSSLMLHLLEQPSSRFLTNDRMFVTSNADGARVAHGIPKLPRVNPGTIISIPRLNAIIGAERCRSLRDLPVAELWELEEKYDVDVQAIYGEDRIKLTSPLKGFVVLNWRRNTDAPYCASQVDPVRRPDLLSAVVKSPGPFYQALDGKFLTAVQFPSLNPMAEMLATVPVWEFSGRVDFQAASEQCRQIMGQW